MTGYRLHERDLASFFQVPFAQYGSDQHYVSPLRRDLDRILDGARNPVFGDPDLITYFTVTRSGRPVGRITAHIHRASNARHRERRGCFGFFDCARDAHAARILLDAASEWLRRRGCDEMVGNFNLTAMQEMGVVVDGHDRSPFMAQHHNPGWIPDLLAENGLHGFFPMSTWSLDVEAVDPDTLLGPAQRDLLDRSDLVVEPIRRRGFGKSLEITRRLLNESFRENPMFVPLSKEEFSFQADQMLWIFDPRISWMVRVRGEPVAVIVCLPDLNPLLRATGSRIGLKTPLEYLRFRLNRRRASLVFGGVVPEMQGRGLAAVLLNRALRGLGDGGYEELGITWISDTNKPSLRQMEKIGARPLHRLKLFRRPL